MAVNLWIAAVALALGLILGLPLGLLQLGGRLQRRLAGALVGHDARSADLRRDVLPAQHHPAGCDIPRPAAGAVGPNDHRPLAGALRGGLCRRQWARGRAAVPPRRRRVRAAVPAQPDARLSRARDVVRRRSGDRRERGRRRGPARGRALADARPRSSSSSPAAWPASASSSRPASRWCAWHAAGWTRTPGYGRSDIGCRSATVARGNAACSTTGPRIAGVSQFIIRSHVEGA